MTKTLDITQLPPEACRPFQVSKGRETNRIAERELDKIPAWLKISGASQELLSTKIIVTLWDYSPFGFTVHFKQASTDALSLIQGQKVHLHLELAAKALGAECRVESIAIIESGIRIGLSRLDILRRNQTLPHSGAPEGECLRLSQRIEIQAEVANPIFFGEWSCLKLFAIRPGLKIEMLSNDPALILFKGQILETHFTLPSSGSNQYRGEIISLDRIYGTTIRLRMRPLKISVGLANDLAELLTFEAGLSPHTLRRYGFPVRFFRNRLTFRFVESMEDYDKVLSLRRDAYVDIGKRDKSTTPSDMAIDWDKKSRILCAFHDEVLIASAGITFPSSPTEILRSETAFPGNTFPGHPPPKTELIEINSLCTHKEYRQGDLLKAVFEHLARIFILSDRKYVMNLSDDNLLPIYLGIGFKDMHETGVFLGRNHHLIKISRRAVTNGKGIGLLEWNILYGDLMEDILERKLLHFSFRERWLLKLKLLLKPFSKRLLQAKQEKRFQGVVDRAKKESEFLILKN